MNEDIGIRLSDEDIGIRLSDEDFGFESDWVKDFAGEYDFCMVFPVVNGGFSEKGRLHIESLQRLNFELFAYKGARSDKDLIVLIRAPISQLRSFADSIEFTMKLDPIVIQKLLEKGDSHANIAPVIIPHRPDISPFTPFEQIYGKYSQNVTEEIYWKESGSDHPFRVLIRLKLCSLLLESRNNDGLYYFNIRKALEEGELKGCFPLHDRAKTQELGREWNIFPRRLLPLYQIKEYFGEKIAVYFAFMQHYTIALTIPACVGVPVQIAVWSTENPSAPFLPVYSFFIALWAVSMLEFWKRREKSVAMEWGTMNFETHEQDRHNYRGEWIDSYINGAKMRYYPYNQRQKHIKRSFGIGIALILLVIGIVVSIYIIRFTITRCIGKMYAQMIASIINAIQIQLLNQVYVKLAIFYTEKENHRTDTQFEDSMIIKIFLFQFVNSYASFFYLAFIAQTVGDCPVTGCMRPLGTNLAIIFGARIVISQVKQNFIPYLLHLHRIRTEFVHYTSTDHSSNNGDSRSSISSGRDSSSGGSSPKNSVVLNLIGSGQKVNLTQLGSGKKTRLTRPEKELLLDEYNQTESSLSDYSEIAVMFGYTALFVTALPIAALFSLFANIAEVKTDGWKLLHLHARPFPKGCEDIGTWQTIFLLLSVISVVTNAGLTVFTMNTLNHFSDASRYWIFILFQWVCFVLQAIIMALIPDIPEHINIQLMRTDYITRKLIDKISDENQALEALSSEVLEIRDYPDFGGVYTHEMETNTNNEVPVQLYKWRSL